MNSIQISIIVPVYNTEAYIYRCLESIKAQTFKDWECILIDDGSTDNSGNICDEYAANDSRFKVIHKKNEGVSIARNTGLKKACGKWIGFIDSDDWIEKETYEIAYQHAINSDADIVQWGYCRSDGKNDYDFQVFKSDYDLGKFEDSLKESEPYFGFILMLIKHSILKDNDITFPENLSMGEDYIFSLKCYMASTNVVNLQNIIFYHYFQNPNSACHTITDKKIEAQIEFIEIFENLIHETKYRESLMKIINRLKAGFKTNMLNEKKFNAYRENFPEIEDKIYSQKKVFRPAMFLVNKNFDFLAAIYINLLRRIVRIKQKIIRSGVAI